MHKWDVPIWAPYLNINIGLHFFLQNLSGHGMLRGSSVGSPGLNSPSALQSPQLRGQPQPWLASSQGKPPLPSHTYRGHMDPQPMQQRAHVPQQQASPGPSQSLQAFSSQQQPQSFSTYQQDQLRQAQSVRPGSAITPHPHTPRGLGHQRPSSFGTAQPFLPGAHNSNAAIDANESSNNILSKRSIHELVNQVTLLCHLFMFVNSSQLGFFYIFILCKVFKSFSLLLNHWVCVGGSVRKVGSRSGRHSCGYCRGLRRFCEYLYLHSL